MENIFIHKVSELFDLWNCDHFLEIVRFIANETLHFVYFVGLLRQFQEHFTEVAFPWNHTFENVIYFLGHTCGTPKGNEGRWNFGDATFVCQTVELHQLLLFPWFQVNHLGLKYFVVLLFVGCQVESPQNVSVFVLHFEVTHYVIHIEQMSSVKRIFHFQIFDCSDDSQTLIRENCLRLFTHYIEEVLEDLFNAADGLGVTEGNRIDTDSAGTVETRDNACDPFCRFPLFLFLHFLSHIGSLPNEIVGEVDGNESAEL